MDVVGEEDKLICWVPIGRNIDTFRGGWIIAET